MQLAGTQEYFIIQLDINSINQKYGIYGCIVFFGLLIVEFFVEMNQGL